MSNGSKNTNPIRVGSGVFLLGGINASETGEAEAGRVRAAQISAMMQFTPLAMLVNIINATLVAYVVWPIANPGVLSVWLIALLLVAGLGLRAYAIRHGKKPRIYASKRGIHHAIGQAAVLAMLWGLVPILWFPASDASAQLVVATVVTGMICAGGFALATVAPAAYTYVIVLTLGSLVGLLASSNPYSFVLAVLLFVYSLVVLRSARGTSRLFANQFVAEAELRERGQVIELLLAEFEENGSDWLFELDSKHIIRQHSSRLLEVMGNFKESFIGTPFSSLLMQAGAASLFEAIAKAEPFRDLVVDVPAGNQVRWWSLTAGPIRNESGQIIGWRGVGSDITLAKAAQDRMAWMACTDVLTGLMNRTTFLGTVAAALSASRRKNQILAVGCLDLDHFKMVNDTLGHPVGDALLKTVSDSLSSFSKEGLIVGRLGGDEFGLLFPPETSPEAAQALIQRVVSELTRSYEFDGKRIAVAASAGLAFDADNIEDVDALLRNADLALYRAKETGRGCIAAYDDTMRHKIEEQRRIRDDLALALERDELALVYQPIVEIATQRPIGFEALLRWHHPERGVVSPALFIPIAESSGLIIPIGEWVLARACAEAAKWPDGLSVSVNVSPIQIGQSDIAQSVLRALDASGLKPARLELEITETLFLRHEAETLAFLNKMRATGVGIALDDFGTGYSSLGYLGRFPIDKLKIDQSFVLGPARIPHRTAIVQAIVGMARSFGITTTAEGVENDAAFAWLRLNGCTFAQGYLFAKPMGAEQIPAYLEGALPASFINALSSPPPEQWRGRG